MSDFATSKLIFVASSSMEFCQDKLPIYAVMSLPPTISLYVSFAFAENLSLTVLPPVPKLSDREYSLSEEDEDCDAELELDALSLYLSTTSHG